MYAVFDVRGVSTGAKRVILIQSVPIHVRIRTQMEVHIHVCCGSTAKEWVVEQHKKGYSVHELDVHECEVRGFDPQPGVDSGVACFILLVSLQSWAQQCRVHVPSARLMELEDERQCFLDEGVYDVVNSICGRMPSGSSLRRLRRPELGACW